MTSTQSTLKVKESRILPLFIGAAATLASYGILYSIALAITSLQTVS